MSFLLLDLIQMCSCLIPKMDFFIQLLMFPQFPGKVTSFVCPAGLLWLLVRRWAAWQALTWLPSPGSATGRDSTHAAPGDLCLAAHEGTLSLLLLRCLRRGFSARTLASSCRVVQFRAQSAQPVVPPTLNSGSSGQKQGRSRQVRVASGRKAWRFPERVELWPLGHRP